MEQDQKSDLIIDNLIANMPVKARSQFLQNTRSRLQLSDKRFDELETSVLINNENLPYSSILPQVRTKISGSQKVHRFPKWFQWVSPVAAAATLFFAFFAFSQSAEWAPKTNPDPLMVDSAAANDFADIFALASSLSSTSDSITELDPETLVAFSQ